MISKTILQQSIESTLPLILMLVFFLFWRALNSYWIKELIPAIRDFSKGEIEYYRPSRPTSETYDNFLHLAQCSPESRVEMLSLTVSKFANEYLTGRKTQVSPSLHLLMTSPRNWLSHQYSSIEPSSTSVKRQKQQIRDHFLEEFILILSELEQQLNLNRMLKTE